MPVSQLQPLYPERFWDRKSIVQLEIRRKRWGGGDARVGAVRKWFMEREAQGVIRLTYAPPRTQEPSQGGSLPDLPLALGHTSLPG